MRSWPENWEWTGRCLAHLARLDKKTPTEATTPTDTEQGVYTAALLAACSFLAPQLLDVPGFGLVVVVLVWTGYFVFLKASPYRTLGYVLGRARIVNYRGQRPGIPRLMGRLLFVIGGPMNFLFDALWLTGDKNRQALRDKFASTYVVRHEAVPVGWGRVRYRTYTFWGMTFIFREVDRQELRGRDKEDA